MFVTFPLSTLKSREMVLYFKKSWLFLNITACGLHLAAVLLFNLKLKFFHYVLFFNPDVCRLQKSIPSTPQLYLLFSTRSYGNRLLCFACQYLQRCSQYLLSSNSGEICKVPNALHALLMVLDDGGKESKSSIALLFCVDCWKVHALCALQWTPLKTNLAKITAFSSHHWIGLQFLLENNSPQADSVPSNWDISITVAIIDASLVWKINSEQ